MLDVLPTYASDATHECAGAQVLVTRDGIMRRFDPAHGGRASSDLSGFVR